MEIDRLLQSNAGEDILLAINLMDKLPENEFWTIVKRNFDSVNTPSTDYILYKPVDIFLNLYCEQYYIKGKIAYYFFNSDLLIIDNYQTAERGSNKEIEIIEEWK